MFSLGKWRFMMSIVMIVAVVAGVFSAGRTEGRRVTVSTQWGGDDLLDLEAWGQRYTEETGVTVSFRSAGEQEFRSTIPLAFQSRQSSTDLMAHPWIELHERFAREGHLLELNDLIDQDQFPQDLLDYVTVDGSIYAVPFRVALKPGFIYKRSFFEANDLVEPATYAEFLRLIEEIQTIPTIDAAIASGNGDGWPLTDVTEGFILGLAGADSFLGIIDGTVNFDDAEILTVMEEIARLIEEGYFSEARAWQAQAEELWNEQYGLFWNHNAIHHGGFSENRDEIGFFPVPETEGVTAAIMYAAIPRYTENLDDARDFIAWIQSQAGQTAFAEVRGELAARLDVPKATYPDYMIRQRNLVEDTQLVPDLDDFIGGVFLETFRDQLKLLWSRPDLLESVIENLSEVTPAGRAGRN